MKHLLAAMLSAMLGLASNIAHAQFDHQHAAWTALLSKHVVLIDGGRASQVRYADFARERGSLKAYLASLTRVTSEGFNGWTKARQVSFLINAYNAYAVEKILTRYPDIRSIWDFGKVFGNPFRDRFFRLLGDDSYLDRIEHETLRKPGVYNEPRVHFAVNCAAIGCPMLREEAYVAERLDTQLEEQTRRFLADRSRNRYSDGGLEVSMIFHWFKEDWTSGYRGLDSNGAPVHSREQFFARYADILADGAEERRAIREHRAAIRHLNYDWGLNDARKK